MVQVARLYMAGWLHAFHWDVTGGGRAHLHSFTLFVHVFERYAGEAFMTQDLADPPVDVDLLDLANVRIAELLDGTGGGNSSALDDLMRRLFDPDEQEHRTISAFSSAL